MGDYYEALEQRCLSGRIEDAEIGNLIRAFPRAIAEVRRLKARVAEMEAALRPFAAMADEIERCAAQSASPYSSPEGWAKSCEWNDLVRARTALTAKEGEAPGP